jgi:glutathione S-transferase
VKLRLFDWGPSPFCLKARAILEYKNLEYERVSILGPAVIELWRRGRIGKVPALDIDGELVCDSTEIAHTLERLVPDPTILPTASRDRALCHALEDWADEGLYFIGLYYHWVHPEGRAALPKAFKGPLGKALLPVYERFERSQLRGHGTARKPERMVLADLHRNLDAVEGLVTDQPFLLGDAPYLCDFAVAGQFAYLGMSAVGRRELEGRAVLSGYLERMRALRRKR